MCGRLSRNVTTPTDLSIALRNKCPVFARIEPNEHVTSCASCTLRGFRRHWDALSGRWGYYRTIANVISKPKDPTPPEAERGVIYQVQCKECDASYIGETGRKRKTRLKEHARDVANSTNATRFKSELVDHAWTSGHQFDFDKASTLEKNKRWGPRKLLESWFIQNDKRGSDSSLVNKNRGPLPDVYTNFMPK
ncbi:GIY-YIG nuclease family protein [Ixodes scapularis]